MGGWVGGRVGGGWEAEGWSNYSLAQGKSRCVSIKHKNSHSVAIATYMSGQNGRWEQFDTTCSLISAPQWHHTT